MAMISKYAKIIAGIVIAVLLAFAFAKTYEHGYSVAQSIGDKNLSDYKASIQQASASAASDAFGKYAADVTRGQAAESGFLNVQSAAITESVALKEHIDDVTQPHVAAPQRAVNVQSAPTITPVYSCVFSLGFVRLWNAAAGIADDSDRALQGGTGPGTAADGPDADATTDSGVSQADILDWFVDYANRAHGTEDKLKGVRAALPAQP
ncbi:hypothetical protein [Paraburkholderia humisilvae]|uniref:Uncharacterized protein n=1 Tax=Paraburkholderia humisilvae TaxID=627669 RepID=A0A6J5ECD6_9BURK|nr:hypothetical protein [Paraburkholderia humisilvae]CAB3764168.1 hypothetical protein LMG29542_04800 [Paraburkholderia humisilvae]